MLTGVHILLTYRCTNECSHCFVFGSPSAEGVFTMQRIEGILAESRKIGTVETIFFEGGEPFLFYPLLLEGVRLARGAGFEVGIVTNGYFATTVEDGRLWLGPLAQLGLCGLSVSDDAFHSGRADGPAKNAIAAAEELGISVGAIAIAPPTLPDKPDRKRGEPIAGGGVRFRGRAAEKLASRLPGVDSHEFTECPHEDLLAPGRVHVDPFGYVHLCQGLCVGNAWETPLSELMASYDGTAHPIAGAIASGGPAGLVREFGLSCPARAVDACHLCYSARKELLDRFPSFLAPPRLYGM